eukprot:4634494-Alexandrium_andersonii.AAC.1
MSTRCESKVCACACLRACARVMPSRPVPDHDDDAWARVAVEGRPPQPRLYQGQLPPGMEGVIGPLPPSRP